MTCTVNGQSVFEGKTTINVESYKRRFVERSATGLDGVLSIDLGKDSRKIVQRGTIRAVSEQQLRDKMADISAFIDGRLYRLVSETGEIFENLRVDSIAIQDRKLTGVGIEVDLEIVYKQLL